MRSINDLEEKRIDFYLKGNDLKYDIISNDRTIAEHLYGSMILALSIQSEFNPSEDISKVIRMIALEGITLTNIDFKCSDYLPNGSKLDKEIEEKNKMVTFDSIFASKCRIMDIGLHDIIEKNKDKCYFELYKEAIRKGIFKPKSIEENKKYQEIFRFYYENIKLDNKERSGWDNTHWNINGRRERVSEHIYGTIILALSMYGSYEKDIDIDKVLETLLIHEIGEILIGDITPFDNVTVKQKEELEHKAMEKVLGNLTDSKNMLKNLLEFDEYKSEESKFSRYCDKLEADIQSKIYEEKGKHNSLNNQENNVAFKSSKIKQMLNEGANTPFDIWYLYDKDIYKDSESFKRTLEYVKDNNITKNKENNLVLTK